MPNAPIPINEAGRLDELQRYAILDTPPQEAFDRLTRLAAQACAVPIALISLVDGERQWFLSRLGFEARQMPREQAFCAHAILDSIPLVIEDTSIDARFADNGLVTGPEHIRFYAGVPLLTPRGFALGSFCVLDRTPRVLSAEQLEILQLLAMQVVQEFELRRVAESLRHQSSMLSKGESTAHIGGWELDLHTQVVTWTDESYRIFEVAPATYTPTIETALGFFTGGGATTIRAAVEMAFESGTAYDLELPVLTGKQNSRWLRLVGNREPLTGTAVRMFGVMQDVTERRHLEGEVLLASQREQARLGYDLHDGLGQELTGISFMLHGLAATVPRGVTRFHDEIGQLETLVTAAIGTCRTLAYGLSPAGRERGGLVHALRGLCGRIEQTFKVRVTIRAREAGAAIDGFSADHLYRIAQESITNAVKHGRANRILVTVETGPAQVLLSVSSNGARLNGSPYSDGLGIRSMRYRARLLGATFSITARPAGGACVLCRMPTNAAVVALLPAAS